MTCQIIQCLAPLPNVDLPDPSKPLWPLIGWVAAHVFGVKSQLVFQGSGSGDKTVDWVLDFCLLIAAMAATIVWSWFDRRRLSYPSLYRWFRLFIRVALAGQFITYGLVKAIPLQMPFPFLTQLMEPYGHFSPMGVLWASIGSSRPYEMFSGCVELAAGLLLMLPRTTVIGALLALIAMTEVFALNMTYDVPVKQLSFHLILLALFLLAPDLLRLTKFLLLSGNARPLPCRRLFATARANRIALAAQVLFGLWLVGLGGYDAWKQRYAYGTERPRPPLYGIWDIEQLSIDGQIHPPLLTDNDRYRRAVFDFPKRMTFESMNGANSWFDSSIDPKKQTLAVTSNGKDKFKGGFTYQRPAPDRLILDGQMAGKKIHMQLKRLDEKKMVLLSRGFHWVQEYPFNR
jgi:uncharacterized membrane protein YphA (DoxX/SURF4 family)